jgi:uncharacterized protein YgiM (DUF1202 family)
MFGPSGRIRLASGLLLLVFVPLTACKKKETQQPPQPGAEASAEKTRPYVTVKDVQVRSGPGTRYKIVAEIKANTRVNVAGQEGGWLRVVSRQGRPPGYIDQRFAEPMGPEEAAQADSYKGTYNTTADVAVREGPGPHYKAVARIVKDTHVTVVGAEGDWLKVQSKRGNPPGYIDSRFAERISD